MPNDVNRVRNADFSQGRSTPTGWVFSASTKQARWHRADAAEAQETTGVTVLCENARASARWSQVVICKPGEFYRVEATAACDLNAPDESAGLMLEVQPLENEQPVGRPLKTPGLHRASKPIAIRAYYQAPKGIRRLKLSVGVVGARGVAYIHHVRFIRILEPEEESHVLAIPLPSYCITPPRIARNVCVCSDQAEARPITGLLAGYFGDQHVQAIRPVDLRPATLGTDALLLPDPMPPPAVRSLHVLMRLAADRIVIISLPAFARLSNSMLSLNRIEQDDDPIHAKVVYANHATRGFALHDAFAYAWPGRAKGSFVQHQYRRTQALKSFCVKHGLTTLLSSLCDKDATSDRPICLFKRTKGGTLFVLDIEPVEAATSTRAEPALAMHLLLSMLGQMQVGLGQYVVPLSNEADFRAHIRDLTERFEQLDVHAEDVPVEELTDQLVTIAPPLATGAKKGRRGMSLNGCVRTYNIDQSPERRQRIGKPRAGVPLAAYPPASTGRQAARSSRAWGSEVPRPVILVRTGLRGGDVESVYGALIWFKQLVRTAPFTCPYAEELAAQFRLAWVPLVAQWESAYGWRRSGSSPTHPMAVATDDAEIAAMIDIVACPVNRARVIFPGEAQGYGRYAAWLPRLGEAFPPGRYFHPTVDEGEGFCNRDRYAWRHVRHQVSVVADDAVFNEPVHHDVLATGGETIRIEVPSCDADYAARSIQSTDLVATLLEHVVGLQFGLLAVNRGPTPVQLNALPPTDPGQALIVHQTDPILRATAARTG